MSWGRFAVQVRRSGTGYRLDMCRFSNPDQAATYADALEFADADTRVVKLTDGMVIVVSELTAFEKRRRAS